MELGDWKGELLLSWWCVGSAAGSKLLPTGGSSVTVPQARPLFVVDCSDGDRIRLSVARPTVWL